MKVLVTGSDGFIGRNLMAALGDRAVPFDLKQGFDARSWADVTMALKQGIDAVVHLAALSGVEQSIREPEASLDNISMVQTVLDACRARGAAFLMASTAGALSGQPRSPYAASKLAGEAYCSAYAWSYAMRTTVLRFGNVYGPESGEKSSAIAGLCRAILRDAPFELYGDGSQRRDFIFVGDLCRGIVRALDHGAEGQYNLASGKLVRLDEVLQTLCRAAKRTPTVFNMPARRGEALGTRIDISGAVEEFGFNPSTTLADGLKQTWKWFSDQTVRTDQPVGSAHPSSASPL